MIKRFCLYGFLKNLRLFDAFLLLAFRDRGLDFASIGALIAVRRIALNALEVPSGALADSFGRRRCMVASMASYVVAYPILGLAGSTPLLAVAMALMGFGDAFRSGTHKALIYSWLRAQGRESDRTLVYGRTRSWSKLGSASSALLGGAVLVAGFDYRYVFLASTLPAALNLLNVATYPASLDAERKARGTSARHTWSNLREGLGRLRTDSGLRSLVVASAAVEGAHAVTKDYLQPLLQTIAIAAALGVAAELSDTQRTGLLVGVVTAAFFLASSQASRHAWRLERRLGGADAAARGLAGVMAGLGVLLGVLLLLDLSALAVVAFVLVTVVADAWRPIHVGRFDDLGAPELASTLLSLESQARSASAALLAVLVGWAVDWTSGGATPVPAPALAPVAVVMLLPLTAAFGRGRQETRPS
ncbi:MAG: MFS transporter [Planctomycetota bacterium]